MDDSPRTLSDADTDIPLNAMTERTERHERTELNPTIADGEVTLAPVGVDHPLLENQPSTSSFHSAVGPLRALVRTLTPKRRPPKPILKAGVHREPGDEENKFRVTFDLPRASVTDSSGGGVTSGGRNNIKPLKGCCDRPLITVAGVLSLIGGMAFGFDLGMLSGIMQPIREHFGLTCGQEQVLLGCLMGGAIIVSICGGPWIDKCGRRRAILISACMFILGSGLSAVASSLDALSAGRLLQGFGMSMAAISQCIYMSEIAPKDKRGFFVGLNELGITLGFVLAFFCGYILHGVKDSWRIMMAIGTIPAAIQVMGTYFFLPPSPREKMMNKYDREAILILDNLRGNRNEAMNEFVSIRHTLVTEDAYGTASLFKSKDNLLYRLLVGVSLVVLQQLSGQGNVLFYAASVFEEVGFSVRWASLAVLSLGGVKVLATILALFQTDKKGRRFFLIFGCLLMSVTLLLLAISTSIRPPFFAKNCLKNSTKNEINFVKNEKNEINFEKNEKKFEKNEKNFMKNSENLSFLAGNFSRPFAQSGLGAGHVAQLTVNFLALIVYVVGYSFGFGPMTWLVLTELYPAGIKGRALSFCNLISWSVGLLLALSFRQTMTSFGLEGMFFLFSIVNLSAALYVFLVVPETERKSLEKVSYELRTTRPKERFDANFRKLRMCGRSHKNRPGPPGTPAPPVPPGPLGNEYSRVERNSLI